MQIGEIKITLILTEVEPDGSSCVVCNDPIFLKAWRYVMLVNKTVQRVPITNRICDSCKDLIE